jgi:IS5 family transposase
LDECTLSIVGPFQDPFTVSQRIRKRVEEIIGWIKTVGGLRRSRYRGLERTQAWGYFVAGTYNLVRLARLEAAA